VRRTWDGLLPVPGDGRYEWDGFLDPDRLPAHRNPSSGFVASANAMNLPADWPRETMPMGFEWDDPSRARRIEECLSGASDHAIASSRAMQNDVMSIPARRVCALLADLSTEDAPPSKTGARAAAWLAGWDHRLAAASGHAALFEVWWSRHLRPALLRRFVPDAVARALVEPGDVERLLLALEADEQGCRDLLSPSLAAAFDDCVSRLGADPAAWTWGALHQLELTQPIVRAVVGPLALGGSESTLMKAAYRASDLRVVMGGALRMVIDVGDWDRSVWINAPGQSADPRSPHHADLAAPWAEGEYAPMAYSDEAVAAVTVATIRLQVG
jgi:penicillin amidase